MLVVNSIEAQQLSFKEGIFLNSLKQNVHGYPFGFNEEIFLYLPYTYIHIH
jgi:hypothetical protein